MARNIRTTNLYHSLNNDWRRRCQSRTWRVAVDDFLRTSGEPMLSTLAAPDVIELIAELAGSRESRYLAIAKRRTIGRIIDRAAGDKSAMSISLHAVFCSVDSYWWPLKFKDHEPEPALAELMMFAFIELSDPDKVGRHRQDPLACVRTNATNRAVSALNTQRRRTRNSDLLPIDLLETFYDECSSHEPGQSLKLLTDEIAAASGQSETSVASFVLHRGFGLSFQDLARATTNSKATHHRRSRRVEQALRAAAA